MKTKIILSAFIVFALMCCKKDGSHNSAAEQLQLKDGPLSAQLGKQIYFGDHGYIKAAPVWGRNSDELFITTAAGILRLDIAAKTVEVLENSGGLVTGKTNENSGIIFLGKINTERGYYVYNFSNNSIEKIIDVPDSLNMVINIAGNNIFCYQSKVLLPDPPCYLCLPPSLFDEATFYHLDKQAQLRTDLKDKHFGLFSTDGSRAILYNETETHLFVFDNARRTIVDSLYRDKPSPLFFNNGMLHSFEMDLHGNIKIKNITTGQIFRQYSTNYFAFFNGFGASADGTRLCYSGGVLNVNSQKILLYNIATNTENILGDVFYEQGTAMATATFALSDDNKKMVIESGNEIYLKVID